MKTLINNKLLALISGEVQRSVKYKVLTIGAGLSFIWLVIIFFLRKNTAALNNLVPLFIFSDAVLMSVLLIGANVFFEKQEGSIRSLLISPVTPLQILIAKVANSVIIALISAVVVSVGTVLLSDVEINIPLLLLYVILTVSAHSGIGYSIALISKDFNAMLVNYMVFVMIFIVPPMLIMLNIIPNSFELIALISPSECGSLLMSSAFSGSVAEWYKILISIVYLAEVAFFTIRYFVYPRFVENAIRG
jgi:fluoroquinolone transport system permease protein